MSPVAIIGIGIGAFLAGYLVMLLTGHLLGSDKKTINRVENMLKLLLLEKASEMQEKDSGCKIVLKQISNDATVLKEAVVEYLGEENSKIISGLEIDQAIDSFVQKLKELDNKKLEQNQIIFFGDSLTENYDLSKLESDFSIYNQGIGGDMIVGLKHRLQRHVLEHSPKQLFIGIGSNDIAAGVSAAKISNEYRTLLDEIKRALPETQVLIQSVYPTTKAHYAKRPPERIEEVNAAIKNLADEFGYIYIDVYSSLVKKFEQITDDGLHLTKQGYKKVTKILQEYIK